MSERWWLQRYPDWIAPDIRRIQARLEELLKPPPPRVESVEAVGTRELKLGQSLNASAQVAQPLPPQTPLQSQPGSGIGQRTAGRTAGGGDETDGGYKRFLSSEMKAARERHATMRSEQKRRTGSNLPLSPYLASMRRHASGFSPYFTHIKGAQYCLAANLHDHSGKRLPSPKRSPEMKLKRPSTATPASRTRTRLFATTTPGPGRSTQRTPLNRSLQLPSNAAPGMPVAQMSAAERQELQSLRGTVQNMAGEMQRMQQEYLAATQQLERKMAALQQQLEQRSAVQQEQKQAAERQRQLEADQARLRSELSEAKTAKDSQRTAELQRQNESVSAELEAVKVNRIVQSMMILLHLWLCL